MNFCCLFTVIKQFDYVFSENGLVAHKNGEKIGQEVGKRLENMSVLVSSKWKGAVLFLHFQPPCHTFDRPTCFYSCLAHFNY